LHILLSKYKSGTTKKAVDLVTQKGKMDRLHLW